MIGRLIKDAKLTVCPHSLVGINATNRPVSFGNYCSVKNNKTHTEKNLWNFWYENLLSLNYIIDNSVDIIEYSKGCIIYDKRIPDEWYYNKLCFTGGTIPTLEEATEIYSLLGDLTNELEQFINPAVYYAKRGREYIVGTTFNYIKYRPNTEYITVDGIPYRNMYYKEKVNDNAASS